MRRAVRTGLAAWLLLLAGCAPAKVERTTVLADFEFRPETVDVPAGAEVTLTLSNQGNHEHVWVLLDKDQSLALPLAIDEANVLARATIDVGGRETLTLTAPRAPGEYPVVCTIPGHAEAGMIGAWRVR